LNRVKQSYWRTSTYILRMRHYQKDRYIQNKVSEDILSRSILNYCPRHRRVISSPLLNITHNTKYRSKWNVIKVLWGHPQWIKRWPISAEHGSSNTHWFARHWWQHVKILTSDMLVINCSLGTIWCYVMAP
jgi:hypothetical protein